tara:strand:+ start:865 stop:1863 length:999 start_codon:yes stop_codon:yes gene_type:complete
MNKSKVVNNFEISVIILTYNRGNDLKKCLDSLTKQTFKNFEVIVIDNGSTDITERILEKYSAKVMRSLKKNKAYLRNLGVKNASGAIIAFIDDDAEAHPQWLENIIQAYSSDRSVGAVGGPAIVDGNQKMLNFYSLASKSTLVYLLLRIYQTVIAGINISYIGRFTSSGVYSIGGSLKQSSSIKRLFSVDILSTCNASVRKNVVDLIGGFDQNFIYNHEDGDLFIRIKEKGYSILFSPRAIVYHHVNPNPQSRASPYYIGRDFGYFYTKDAKPLRVSWKIRKILNITLFNIFWIYQAIRLHNLSLLKTLIGFVDGFILARQKIKTINNNTEI